MDHLEKYCICHSPAALMYKERRKEKASSIRVLLFSKILMMVESREKDHSSQTSMIRGWNMLTKENWHRLSFSPTWRNELTEAFWFLTISSKLIFFQVFLKYFTSSIFTIIYLEMSKPHDSTLWLASSGNLCSLYFADSLGPWFGGGGKKTSFWPKTKQ